MSSSAIGPAGLTTQTALLDIRQDQMLDHLRVQKSVHEEARIESGAKQFEAMLLSGWLQQAEQSFGTVPGAGDEDDAVGREQMMSLGVQSLAQAMADSGGIGLARMIAKSLGAAAERGESAPGTGEKIKK